MEDLNIFRQRARFVSAGVIRAVLIAMAGVASNVESVMRFAD